MEKVRRPRRGESVWRQILARQQQSTLTVQAFCQREGIGVASFYGWRSRLKCGAGERAPGRRTSPGFIDLGDLGDLQAKRERFEVRLELGAGMVLSIGRG